MPVVMTSDRHIVNWPNNTILMLTNRHAHEILQITEAHEFRWMFTATRAIMRQCGYETNIEHQKRTHMEI
jgi:hypothetical protein